MTDVGEIIKVLNDFGRFQHRLVALLNLISFSYAFHVFGQLFMFGEEPHYCRTAWFNTTGWNLTEEDRLHLTIPRKSDGTLEECFMYTPVEWDLDAIVQYGLNATEKCQEGWVYPSKREPSLVTQVWCQNERCRRIQHRSCPIVCKFFRVLPESPRWLVTKGKVEEAKKLLLKAAAVNKRSIPPEMLDQLNAEKTTKSAGILELVKNPHLRKVTFLLSAIWFVNSLTYYGLSLNVGSFGLDIYLTQLIFGAVEIPARGSSLFVMQWLGRKKCQAFYLLLGGIVCLLITAIPKAIARKHCYHPFSLAVVFSVFLRQTGNGVCQMVSRMGGIISPLIPLLEKYHTSIPVSIFGGTAVVAGILSLLLPETHGKELPDYVEDAIGNERPSKTDDNGLGNGHLTPNESNVVSEPAKMTRL
ncbi:hypothetical protein JD844_003626 [Phrynosoma platyrhinos]|uniref:Solute carrier family 22 member 13 n=1 Tax=Phrynosoma platyrhinos TaxID=52577 RepID=A0ABQ7TDD6_PHRPL|nr:hypothetical protein JD844_003626 [Phrynosoma platyrhinos]